MDLDDAHGVLAWLPAGTQLQQDVTPADWVVERLRPWATEGVRLESFAPSGFEAYARVFHPARDPAGGSVRWTSLAKARGIELTSDMGFLEVSGIAAGDARSLDDVGRATAGSRPTSATRSRRCCC